jgi:hypothetical protein
LAWGSSDLAHFGRVFRQHFGMSPRDWRPSRSRPDENIRLNWNDAREYPAAPPARAAIYVNPTISGGRSSLPGKTP